MHAFKTAVLSSIVALAIVLAPAAVASAGTAHRAASAASDSTFSSSAPANITLVSATKRVTVTLLFTGNTTVLTHGSKLRLEAFVKRVHSGESVTITGYSKGFNLIAKSRCRAVGNFLAARVSLSEKLVTTSSSLNNRVTVVTTN